MRYRLFWFLLLSSPLWAQSFPLQITAAKSPALKPWVVRFQKDPGLREVMTFLNEAVKLPRPVPILFAESGKVNAWYAPEQHQLIFSYELAAELEKAFAASPRYSGRSVAMAQHACLFILLHEVGHALIAELDVPWTGKNEDSADELAVILASRLSCGQEAARSAAEWFRLTGFLELDAKKTPFLFWDEHSMNMQRYYNILANLEAAMPGGLSASENLVPAQRLQRSRERWPRKLKAWGLHLKQAFSGLSVGEYPQPGPSGGSLRVIFEPPTSRIGTQVAALLEGNQDFSILCNFFAKTYRLPRELAFTLVDDSSLGCRYQPELHRVAMSYQHVVKVFEPMLRHFPSEEEAGRYAGASLQLETLVKLQQMILHELQIPITGEEEDAAVDAVTCLLSGNKFAQGILLGASEYFQVVASDNPNLLTYNYSDEDDLPAQRQLDIYMNLYVRDPQKFVWVTTWVDKRRLRRFELEHPQVLHSWARLLPPYTTL